MRRRFNIEDIAAINKEPFSLKELKEEKRRFYHTKRFFRRLYYLSPKPIKRLFNKFLDEHFVKKFEN